MLFVFSWPATTLLSRPLQGWIEYQYEPHWSRYAPLKNSGALTEKFLRGKNENDATQLPPPMAAEMRPK